jgi:hypothetical protein
MDGLSLLVGRDARRNILKDRNRPLTLAPRAQKSLERLGVLICELSRLMQGLQSKTLREEQFV